MTVILHLCRYTSPLLFGRLAAPWSEAGRAIEALLDRRVNGKAVLRVGE
jgi:hypothetical protein